MTTISIKIPNDNNIDDLNANGNLLLNIQKGIISPTNDSISTTQSISTQEENDEDNYLDQDDSDSGMLTPSSDSHNESNSSWPLRVSKGNWTPDEDEILANAVNSNHGNHKKKQFQYTFTLFISPSMIIC